MVALLQFFFVLFSSIFFLKKQNLAEITAVMTSAGRICVLLGSRKGKWWEIMEWTKRENWEATRD